MCYLVSLGFEGDDVEGCFGLQQLVHAGDVVHVEHFTVMGFVVLDEGFDVADGAFEDFLQHLFVEERSFFKLMFLIINNEPVLFLSFRVDFDFDSLLNKFI